MSDCIHAIQAQARIQLDFTHSGVPKVEIISDPTKSPNKPSLQIEGSENRNRLNQDLPEYMEYSEEEVIPRGFDRLPAKTEHD